jgi:glycosyltransferase involved in cell wall biosynthesis
VALSAAEPAVPKLTSADSDLTGACGILIPAFNEAKTVGSVVRVAMDSGIGPVLVIDDGSTDETAEQAKQAGAVVLSLTQNGGKGKAVVAGAVSMRTDYVLLIDADLINLTPKHLEDLVRPVLNGLSDMTRGFFRGGRWYTTAAQLISPQLNGQRMLRRENLLNITDLEDSGYGIEIAITNAARKGSWRVIEVPLAGVSQLLKEEKRGLLNGLRSRAHMYWDIFLTVAKGFRL